MIRRILVMAVAGGLTALGLERWLAAHTGEPRPIRTFVVIDAPPERVWSELTDIEGQPRWMREMKEVRILTPSPLGVGTRGSATVRILGVRTQDPVTVTVFEPPTRFGIRHEGAFSGHGSIELVAGADGTSTVVGWEEVLVPPLLPHLGAALQRPVLERIFQDDLGRLRELIEGPAMAAEPAAEPAAGGKPATPAG